MSDKSYQRSLPKKRMSAGALFFDEAGKLLIVEPVYKPNWEIPGGAVELNESPYQACVREVREELGLERPLHRLLCVDYLRESADKTEALVFVFLGGVLTEEDKQSIRLPEDELRRFSFLELEAAYGRFNQRLSQRVRQSIAALADGRTVYLEDEQIPAGEV